jgi:hypothetical protein
MSRHLAHDGFTASFSRLNPEMLDSNAIYIFSKAGVEPRSRAEVWNKLILASPEQCIEIVKQDERSFTCIINGSERCLSLTNTFEINILFSLKTLYIDITGLIHGVWSALFRAALSNEAVEESYIVYCEPDIYQSHQSPSSSNLFDLTSSFGGIGPLPGMANLAELERGVRTVLVTFLGFESARAQHIANSIDPAPKTIPVVGLPGFRIDYPQVTVASNETFLDDTRSHSNVKYALASCPFEAFSVLSEIRRDNPGSFIYIAPIGTKPHALGAVWFAIQHPQETEVIYDHPIRKTNRSAGIGQIHIYKVKPRDVNL